MMTKARRCPKCSGKIDHYTEIWSAKIDFDADQAGLPKTNEDGTVADGILTPCDPEYLMATCGECGHEWRLKKVFQITDLIKNQKST